MIDLFRSARQMFARLATKKTAAMFLAAQVALGVGAMVKEAKGQDTRSPQTSSQVAQNLTFSNVVNLAGVEVATYPALAKGQKDIVTVKDLNNKIDGKAFMHVIESESSSSEIVVYTLVPAPNAAPGKFVPARVVMNAGKATAVEALWPSGKKERLDSAANGAIAKETARLLELGAQGVRALSKMAPGLIKPILAPDGTEIKGYVRENGATLTRFGKNGEMVVSTTFKHGVLPKGEYELKISFDEGGDYSSPKLERQIKGDLASSIPTFAKLPETEQDKITKAVFATMIGDLAKMTSPDSMGLLAQHGVLIIPGHGNNRFLIKAEWLKSITPEAFHKMTGIDLNGSLSGLTHDGKALKDFKTKTERGGGIDPQKAAELKDKGAEDAAKKLADLKVATAKAEELKRKAAEEAQALKKTAAEAEKKLKELEELKRKAAQEAEKKPAEVKAPKAPEAPTNSNGPVFVKEGTTAQVKDGASFYSMQNWKTPFAKMQKGEKVRLIQEGADKQGRKWFVVESIIQDKAGKISVMSGQMLADDIMNGDNTRIGEAPKKVEEPQPKTPQGYISGIGTNEVKGTVVRQPPPSAPAPAPGK